MATRVLEPVPYPRTRLRGVHLIGNRVEDLDPPNREWFVYFVQDDRGGPIKIGKTQAEVRWRCVDLQIGYPFGELRLVGVMVGLGSLEKELHQTFAPLWMRGEWFRPGEELLNFIAALPEVP